MRLRADWLLCLAVAITVTTPAFLATSPPPKPSAQAASPPRVFPGAEGHGAKATVTCTRDTVFLFRVTTLAHGGDGSLEAVIEDSLALHPDTLKVVVFDTAGTISKSGGAYTLGAGADCFIIAGQTARGAGILLKNDANNGHRLFQTNPTSDDNDRFYVGYLRFYQGECGSDTTASGDCRDAGHVEFGEGSRDYYIDHIQTAYGIDESGLGSKPNSGGDSTYNWTYAYSFWGGVFNSLREGGIAAPGDGGTVLRSVGSYGGYRSPITNGTHIQITGSVIMHDNISRPPVAQGCVDQDSDGNCDTGWEPTNDLYKNFFILMDATNDFEIVQIRDNADPNITTSLYVEDNIYYPVKTSPSTDNWDDGSNAYVVTQSSGNVSAFDSTSGNRRYTPLSATADSPDVQVTEWTAQKAYDSLVANRVIDHCVGVCRLLDYDGVWRDTTNEGNPVLDSLADTLLVALRDSTAHFGFYPGAEAGYVDFPTIDADTSCTDTDGDGMCDAWEDRFSLVDKNTVDHFTDEDGDGWTAIEEYVYVSDPDVATEADGTEGGAGGSGAIAATYFPGTDSARFVYLTTVADTGFLVTDIADTIFRIDSLADLSLATVAKLCFKAGNPPTSVAEGDTLLVVTGDSLPSGPTRLGSGQVTDTLAVWGVTCDLQTIPLTISAHWPTLPSEGRYARPEWAD